jgi:elongation factor 1-beta
MGDVAVLFKVMPEDTETDLDAVKDAIKDAIAVDGMEEEAVAFGLKAVKVSTILEDAEGGPDDAQDALEAIDGVRSVELTDMNRL